jgi:2'-5' RNA ligase
MDDHARTGLCIPALEAEPLVGPWRARLDPSGAKGMPAHITLLFPFLATGCLTADVLESLRSRFARVAPFDFALPRTDRFLEVIYLAPEPDEPFRDLVRTLAADWPEHPPYQGEFAVTDILPHLTVAFSSDPDELDRIDDALQPGLPIVCRAREAWLMAEQEDGWRLHTAFPLGGAGDGSLAPEPPERP